jgi:hypothetical protein
VTPSLGSEYLQEEFGCTVDDPRLADKSAGRQYVAGQTKNLLNPIEAA